MNFALILFLCAVFTGVIWFYDRFFLHKQRLAEVDEALMQFDATSMGIPPDQRAGQREKLRYQKIKPPAWIEYTGGFFPVIVVVFALRSFLVEPFRIPSGSMIPTLLVGDLILVNKFTYGIRIPVINRKIVELNEPQPGDVVVFRYPKDPKFDYIKRVVGTPGDVVEYRDKHLIINNVSVQVRALEPFFETDRLAFSRQFSEKIGSTEHRLLVNDIMPPSVEPWEFPMKDHCTYNARGFRCQVPAGHYFMMGDNRDNSQDSRYWGFVPEANIVGKAFFIWLSFNDLTPSFSRVGMIH